MFKCEGTLTFKVDICKDEKEAIRCSKGDDFEKNMCEPVLCPKNCVCQQHVILTCLINHPILNKDNLIKSDSWKIIKFSNFSFKPNGYKFFEHGFIYLLKLEIFNCSIERIDKLNNLFNLIVLNLTKNLIRELFNEDFKLMKILQILILSENNLICIEKDFKFPESLITLNLSFSNVKKFSLSSFHYLKNLNLLDLSNSNLNEYSDKLLNELKKLKYLNIKKIIFKNENEEFRLKHFKNLKNLKKLYCDKKKFCCFIKFYRKIVDCYLNERESLKNCHQIIPSIFQKSF